MKLAQTLSNIKKEQTARKQMNEIAECVNTQFRINVTTYLRDLYGRPARVLSFTNKQSMHR